MARLLTLYEMRQRGCKFCKNVTTARNLYGDRTACPFDECPYKVLDKYNSYEEFMASEDSKILVPEFFSSVSGFYDCPKRNASSKRLYSDGMDKVDY